MNVSIFTMPRPFVNNFKMIQYNAIKSWLLLDPTPEVILCGNDEGTAEVAKELGIIHVSNIKLSDTGGPLIDSVFEEAKSVAKNSILTCINSDIILVDDFLDTLDTVVSVLQHKFMIVGQRWDMDIFRYLDFSNPSWPANLWQEVQKYGKLHPACGVDYFVFEKNIEIKMLPFPVGRTCWDNWFISQALKAKIAVVDATPKIFAVHQNHRQFHAKEWKNNRTGKESKMCRKLSLGNLASILNATWKFREGNLVKR